MNKNGKGHIYIKGNLHERLSDLKTRTGRSIDFMVNQAIEMWLDTEGEAEARSMEKASKERRQRSH